MTRAHEASLAVYISLSTLFFILAAQIQLRQPIQQHKPVQDNTQHLRMLRSPTARTHIPAFSRTVFTSTSYQLPNRSAQSLIPASSRFAFTAAASSTSTRDRSSCFRGESALIMISLAAFKSMQSSDS